MTCRLRSCRDYAHTPAPSSTLRRPGAVRVGVGGGVDGDGSVDAGGAGREVELEECVDGAHGIP